MPLLDAIKGLISKDAPEEAPTIEERAEDSTLSVEEMKRVVEASKNEEEIAEKIERMEQMKEHSAAAVDEGKVAQTADFNDRDAIEVKELTSQDVADELRGSNNLDDKGEINFDSDADYLREATEVAQAINGENAWEGAHTNGNAEVDARIERTQTGDGGMGR